MQETQPAPQVSPARQRWGLGDVVLGLVAGTVLSAVAAAAVVVALGTTAVSDLSIGTMFLLQLPLWGAMTGVTVFAARRKGGGSLAADFGLRFEKRDLWVGLAAGWAAQFVMFLVYTPLSFLVDETEMTQGTTDVIEKGSSPLSVALLILMVGVCAPFVEELFFRGLAYGAFLKRSGPTVALFGSSFLFGAIHGQVYQLPALVMLGFAMAVLAKRAGRLGPAIVMHAVFNTTTVVLALTLG